MRLTFTPSAWEDYLWVQDHDRKLLKRLNSLIYAATATEVTIVACRHHYVR